MTITEQQFYDMLNVDEHMNFTNRIQELVFDKKGREEFYSKILNIHHDMSVDFFRDYFMTHSAVSAKGQHYTPDALGKLTALLVGGYGGADLTGAGTGTLIIQKWQNDRMNADFFNYLPSNYWYQALELSDEAISFLIHAFAIRGMNGVIIHGDALEMAVKQVYFIQNSANNPIGFSEINVIPHSKDAMEFLGINEWTEQAIEHIESKFPDWIPLIEEKKEQMSLFDEVSE
ncbi:hypothetical protein LB438_07945 [Lactococcus lactis subsp. lactis]